jgi:hypothetical protein
MKRAVSISIGSKKRDKNVEIDLLGEHVRLERIGTDGDMEKAARMYQELDGQVDAFGMGGADLGLMVAGRWYPLYSTLKIVRYVKLTPLVDGNGLKNTLETQAAAVVDGQLSRFVPRRRILIVTAADRWGMATSFMRAGYACVFGDLMFALGLPLALRNEATLRILARLLIPIVTRLPFAWMYPFGANQEIRTPKFEKFYDWADVIAGDCHYIRHHLPKQIPGKVIVTNTTTPQDLELFRRAGASSLVTTTPVLEGRSFGTNAMEAAILAAMGRKEQVDYTHPGTYFDELKAVLTRLGMSPQVQVL